MRHLNDDSGVFFTGDVVTGLKLDGVPLSPARCVGAVSILSGSIQKIVPYVCGCNCKTMSDQGLVCKTWGVRYSYVIIKSSPLFLKKKEMLFRLVAYLLCCCYRTIRPKRPCFFIIIFRARGDPKSDNLDQNGRSWFGSLQNLPKSMAVLPPAQTPAI